MRCGGGLQRGGPRQLVARPVARPAAAAPAGRARRRRTAPRVGKAVVAAASPPLLRKRNHGSAHPGAGFRRRGARDEPSARAARRAVPSRRGGPASTAVTAGVPTSTEAAALRRAQIDTRGCLKAEEAKCGVERAGKSAATPPRASEPARSSCRRHADAHRRRSGQARLRTRARDGPQCRLPLRALIQRRSAQRRAARRAPTSARRGRNGGRRKLSPPSARRRAPTNSLHRGTRVHRAIPISQSSPLYAPPPNPSRCSPRAGRTHHLAEEALVSVVEALVLKLVARREVQRPPHEDESERDESDKIGAVARRHRARSEGWSAAGGRSAAERARESAADGAAARSARSAAAAR
jgi:hypothetical protein